LKSTVKSTDVLRKHGWQLESDGSWKHPGRVNQKIVVNPVGGWTHVKVDIIAPNDWIELAKGIGGEDLERYFD
jgi:hypothetical protein